MKRYIYANRIKEAEKLEAERLEAEKLEAKKLEAKKKKIHQRVKNEKNSISKKESRNA